MARLTPEEMRRAGVTPPAAWAAEVRRSVRARRRLRAAAETDDADGDTGDRFTTPLYGGGTLVFDEFGRLKYHVHNDVFGRRQSARLAYLYQAGLLRTELDGVRLSAARLSALHRQRALGLQRSAGEGW